MELSVEEKKQSENKGRFFQVEWINQHKWLWYHREKRAVFCGVCSQYKQPRHMSPFIFSDSAPGFRNCRKGKERINEHEQSGHHTVAATNARSQHPGVNCQLDDSIKEQQRLRRQGLVAHLNTMKTLLRQGLAIRGHTDEDSNIRQFNKDKAINDVGLQLPVKENKFFSHDILAEQEECIVLHARRGLLDEINASDFYSIICDESSDISKMEQLSISVRYCNNTYDIYEDFIGALPCDRGLTSEALLKYVEDILIRCDMAKEKIVGIAFDGASSMKCLATLINKKMSKHALYLHCFAHCNELVFKDATTLSSLVANAQDLCEDMYALVGVSPKRVLLFENIQKEMSGIDENVLRIRNLSRTRWTTRGAAAEVVFKKHFELQETLRKLSGDVTVTPECRAKSRGLLKKIQTFSEMFKLIAMQELAYLLENNSKQLQSSSLTAERAMDSITKLYIRLQELRSNEEFGRIYSQVENLTGLNHDNDSNGVKRKRTTPGHMRDYVVHSRAPIEITTSGKRETLLRLFYKAINAISEAIKSRFDQGDLGILKAIDKCLVNGANGKCIANDVRKNLSHLSQSGGVELVRLDILVNELQELPIHIKLYNTESDVLLRTITKVSTICEVLNKKPSSKQCLPEIHKLLKLYNSVALGSATAERSFSVMRRIKSWLRSTMTANSLNSRMFATIHKDRISKLHIPAIAKEFIQRNDYRRNYFGHF